MIAIGGGDDEANDSSILREFIKLAKDKNAVITVMTAATEHPETTGPSYKKLFEDLGVKKVNVIDVLDRADAMSEANADLLRKETTGVFFTGGDQVYITSLIGGSLLHDALRELYANSGVIAGTSAGASMMSNLMILGGDSDVNPRVGCVETTAGLGLVTDCIIDVHFSQRGRHGRVLAAVAHYPQNIGIGIDEATAIILDGTKFRVIGRGSVTVIDASGMSYTNAPELERGQSLSMADVRVHVLSEGHIFDIEKRALEIQKKKTH